MAIVLTLNENLEQIIIEAERLNDIEQKELLAYARTLNLNKKKKKKISKPEKGLAPISMEEIDRIKHESRNYYDRFEIKNTISPQPCTSKTPDFTQEFYEAQKTGFSVEESRKRTLLFVDDIWQE